MYSLLLAIIYLAFISLGLPDSLLGSAWPALYPRLGVPVAFAGILTFIISCGTVVSSLLSDRLTRRFGAGLVTAVSVFLTMAALFGFSASGAFWMLCLSYETEFMGDGRKLSFPWRYSFSLNEIMYRYIGFGFILPYEATKQSSSINNCSIIPTESCWARS